MVEKKQGFSFYPPYVFMALVLLMYVVKVIAKIYVGRYLVFSPVIEGDGFHNMSDIFESMLVIAAIWFGNRAINDDYPFGRKNVESFFEITVSVALFCVSSLVLLKSFIGLLEQHYLEPVKALISQFITLPKFETLVVDQQYFWTVFGTMAVSALMSFLVSKFQIDIGRKTSHPVMIADGHETRSDGIVEAVASIGILGEYTLGAPWIEYPLGMIVSYIMFGTALEIWSNGWTKVLQKSAGVEIETKIREVTMGVYGVDGVEDLKTFKAGSNIVCLMKIITSCDLEIHNDIKLAVAHRVTIYMEENNLGTFDYYIRFAPPELPRQRVAYAIIFKDNIAAIAPTIFSATHIRLCDMVGNLVIRWKDVAVPSGSISDKDKYIQELATLLREKKTSKLYSFGVTSDGTDQEVISSLALLGIELFSTPSFLPDTLGINDHI